MSSERLSTIIILQVRMSVLVYFLCRFSFPVNCNLGYVAIVDVITLTLPPLILYIAKTGFPAVCSAEFCV